MLYRAIKYLTQKTYQPLVVWYLKKDRYYRYHGIRIKVAKGVFHPGLFFSTRFILHTLEKVDLKDKSLLELGAGSGLISFFAARKGANVVATDISAAAIQALRENKDRPDFREMDVTILQSDMLDDLGGRKFDYILINPPYYPKRADNEAEMAWYCGAHFEYFEKLFRQIGAFLDHNTTAWMSISQDCNIDQIHAIADKNRLILRVHRQKRIWWEKNYLYAIERI